MGLHDASRRAEASEENPCDVKDFRIWAMPLTPELPGSLWSSDPLGESLDPPLLVKFLGSPLVFPELGCDAHKEVIIEND